MNVNQHTIMAERITRSLAKCGPNDCEMKIEAAMLAGTHWLNAALHGLGATETNADVFHTYLLTINEFRRLSVADATLMQALAEIEDLRPPFVRGNWPGAQEAAARALDLMQIIRAKAQASRRSH